MDDNIQEEYGPTIITVDKLSKTFVLPHEKQNSVKGAFINLLRGGNKAYEKQRALRNISFEIKQGEFFGIVGKNGSGKSTLLKLLAGIYIPTKGSIHISGKLTPFIELGVGFNPELTGRENVFLNGALLGFSRKEMKAMYQEIVDFAGIERFMDQKLKNYSSGMQVRLAFSIAIRVESDILLIDEVLAVGDVAFQQKCFDYFDRLKDEKRTIILVTHDMSVVKQFCNRALFINDSRLISIGDPEEISRLYETANYSKEEGKEDTKPEEAEEAEDIVMKLVDKSGRVRKNFEYGEPIQLNVTWPKDKLVGAVGAIIYKGTEVVFAANTVGQNCNFEDGKVTWKVNGELGSGRYFVTATLFGKNRKIVISRTKQQRLLVYNQPEKGKHDDEWLGITYIENEWSA
jgi:ABC-type polysaccharide/polyol phosphate transport system ATPase subunit